MRTVALGPDSARMRRASHLEARKAPRPSEVYDTTTNLDEIGRCPYAEKMRPSLAPLLQSIALATATAAAIAACGGTTTPGELEVDDAGIPPLAESVCENGQPIDVYRGHTLSEKAEGLEIRLASEGNADAGASFTVLGTAGELCKSAADKSACLAQVRATSATGGWNPYNDTAGSARVGRAYAVSTKGSTVSVHESLAALLDVIRPIDTRSEAMLVAQQNRHFFACNKANARPLPEGGYELITQTGGGCSDLVEHLVRVSADGTFTVVRSVIVTEYPKGTPCAVGRRPEGLVSISGAGERWSASLGAFFAEVAHLEAASVHTFADLRARLRVLGAPSDLLERLEHAEADEVRHTEAMARLAVRFGGTVSPPVIAQVGERSLFDLAVENMREGCVRETYGALLASYQALCAQDPEVRETMLSVAADETAHAELSWDLAAWYGARLSHAENAALEVEKRKAIAELARVVREDPAQDVMARAGMPDANAAQRLLAELDARWLSAA